MTTNNLSIKDKDTVHVISDPRAMSLVSSSDAIAAIEDAFRSLSDNEVQSLPRRRIYIAQGDREYFWHNTMAGWLPSAGTLAVRMDVARVRLSDDGKMEFPGNFSGFVMLFEAVNCAPYAIIHDHLLSPTRVAATSALASRMLARADSQVIGFIGGGEQAIAHMESHLSIFPDLKEIRVFIRTTSKRKLLEERLNARFNVRVKAVDTSEEAVAGSDIVIACTNAQDPVVIGKWLEPGQHVVTIASPDKYISREEIDRDTVTRSDIIVVNSIEQIDVDRQEPLHGMLEERTISRKELLELPTLLKSRTVLRTSSDQITLYDNNVGMGVQFAALGTLLVERAIKSGYAYQVPADIFLTRRANEADVFAP